MERYNKKQLLTVEYTATGLINKQALYLSAASIHIYNTVHVLHNLATFYSGSITNLVILTLLFNTHFLKILFSSVQHLIKLLIYWTWIISLTLITQLKVIICKINSWKYNKSKGIREFIFNFLSSLRYHHHINYFCGHIYILSNIYYCRYLPKRNINQHVNI